MHSREAFVFSAMIMSVWHWEGHTGSRNSYCSHFQMFSSWKISRTHGNCGKLVLWLMKWCNGLMIRCADRCYWNCRTLHHCETESVKSPFCAVMTAALGKNTQLSQPTRQCRSASVVTLKVKVIMSASCMGARLLSFFHFSVCATECVSVY